MDELQLALCYEQGGDGGSSNSGSSDSNGSSRSGSGGGSVSAGGRDGRAGTSFSVGRTKPVVPPLAVASVRRFAVQLDVHPMALQVVLRSGVGRVVLILISTR